LPEQYKLKTPIRLIPKPNGEQDARELQSRLVGPALQMITFQIAGYLTEFTDGRAEIKIDGDAATVGEALNRLWKAHVGLRDRVLTERGEVRPHVNVFVNSQVVRRDQVLQVPIEGETEICIMPAVSGGTEPLALASG
jgi:molybdopterin synthase sulfur carrier subunit